jgi:hypothetical protein
MAANKPKLEFYRLRLNPREEGDFKTFKDFAITVLKAKKSVTNAETVKLCFNHFMRSLNKDFAKSSSLQKQITLVRGDKNKYFDKKPVCNSSKFLIHGVLNGGSFGKDRILGNTEDPKDNQSVGEKKTVLQYYYFLAYIPPDHNEGFFMIHSNNASESITNMFRRYISKVFSGKNYRKAIPAAFCPTSFQQEFRDGANIASLMFDAPFIENIPSADGVKDFSSGYTIKIEAIPKKKDISVLDAGAIHKWFTNKLFGSDAKKKTLKEFKAKLNAKNEVDKSSKIFEWNTRDSEFVPVVYLSDRITGRNSDGTLNFDELASYCKKIFNDEILKEIRPDLDVKKRS